MEGGESHDRYVSYPYLSLASSLPLRAQKANAGQEVCIWNPDSNGQIKRDSRVADFVPGLSRFSEVVLHQGRMEQFFLDAIRESYPPAGSGGELAPIRVERCVMPMSISIDEAVVDSDDAHPVTVKLRYLPEEEATPVQRLSNLSDGLFRSNLAEDDVEGILARTSLRDHQEEVVRCKYVVGCDGAHSWTRKTLGKEYEMVGEMTDYIW